MKSIEAIRKELEKRRSEALLGGGQERIDKQHSDGKMTARERIEYFLDPGSFVELNMLAEHQCSDFGMEKNKPYGDGVITGYGKVEGRVIFLYAQDVPAGIFRFNSNIGNPELKGSSIFDAVNQTYTLKGSGYNIEPTSQAIPLSQTENIPIKNLIQPLMNHFERSNPYEISNKKLLIF
jgi:hypothetical protein